jgi:hypothetical protein
MLSDFGHARELLEQAWLQLPGDDETSRRSREAIDLLIEVVATAEHSKPYRPTAKIIRFNNASR